MEEEYKKRPQIDKIEGFDENFQKSFNKSLEGKIKEFQKPLECEREKTEEEKEIINDILEKIPAFVKEYGAIKERDISLEQIHILDDKNFKNVNEFIEFLEKNELGMYNPAIGRIDITRLSENYLKMSHYLVNQLIRANAFFSIKNDGNIFDYNKIGFSFGKKEEEIKNFGYMNLAIMEELVKRFCQKYFPDIRLLKNDFNKTNNKKIIKYNSQIDPLSAEYLGIKYKYSHLNERIRFVNMVDLLYKKNKNEFKSYEDVFKLFSTAVFQGSLMPIARLFKKTFNSYENFRKEAKETRYPAEYYYSNFIKIFLS